MVGVNSGVRPVWGPVLPATTTLGNQGSSSCFFMMVALGTWKHWGPLLTLGGRLLSISEVGQNRRPYVITLVPPLTP